jgi:hypothetical protein
MDPLVDSWQMLTPSSQLIILSCPVPATLVPHLPNVTFVQVYYCTSGVRASGYWSVGVQWGGTAPRRPTKAYLDKYLPIAQDGSQPQRYMTLSNSRI